MVMDLLNLGLESELKVISKENVLTIYDLMGYNDVHLTDIIEKFTLNLIRKNVKKSKNIQKKFFAKKRFNLLNLLSKEKFLRASKKQSLRTFGEEPLYFSRSIE